MKRNFKVAIRNYRGGVMTDSNGQPQMMNEVLGLHLFNGSNNSVKADDESLKRAYNLSVQMHTKPSEVECTTEDLTMIKEVAKLPWCQGYIVRLLN
mgnify:CR=1 FL=1|jgi:hypothetical protein